MKGLAGLKIVVGMSGGVESSVAALLLQQQAGRAAVSGLFMKNWEENVPGGECPAERDVRDALAVCDRLGIELDAVNFAGAYRERVFEYFLAEYRAGRTPNPDILCNSEIKFRVFLDHALASGADRIATGHYARVEERDGVHYLLKGLDPGKDQSYFLHALTQQQLSRAVFPLGGLHKSEVRRLARDAGLVNHAKKDSTGICFIGERNFREFLGRYLPAQPGEIHTPEGKALGTHEGLMFYTLGQRKGLGIGGRVEGSGDAWYVVSKDVSNNVLVVAQGHDHPALFSRALHTEGFHWIAGRPPARLPYRCRAKTRYRQGDQSCLVEHREGGCRVVFDEPQRAVTPGQFVVLYDGEVCLGGGVIAAAEGGWMDVARASGFA
ncbi:MAG: tRNA 2-thiouridine(34) synthase MnmA [Gammaproteobacteria bacterium]|nr:tRNA 2-thiouridine(34) synthase MnmA [Gammaproteobacteria bacterium]